jgi:ribosomal protein S18 acetylase RimI-like enzyme
VVTAVRREDHVSVRPFDPYRDSRAVAELIAVAFSGKLGPDGEIALAEMRRVIRWGPLLWWLYWPGLGGSGVAPGFVWVEEGRVVGNVSVRRASGWGGFLIGNVAVHPDWQRRGIASALMEAALEAISAQGGRWVGLEVRTDNDVARRLYEYLNFREVGRTQHMLRPAGAPWMGGAVHHPALRRGRSSDSGALIDLVKAIVPAPHRPLLELREADYRLGWERTLNHWLEGRHEAWWVVEEGGAICGTVRTLHGWNHRPDRMEVWVVPKCAGRFETVLVQRGIASLHGARGKMVDIVLPGPTEPLVAALGAVGFQKIRVLIQMRLDLVRRIAVKG